MDFQSPCLHVDREDIVRALVTASRRGALVALVVDYGCTVPENAKPEQRRVVQMARGEGIVVRVLRGNPLGPEYAAVGRNRTAAGVQSLRGISHAKALVGWDPATGEAIVGIGSSNFTTSSRANVELCVKVKLEAAAAAPVIEWSRETFQAAASLKDAMDAEAQKKGSRYAK